MSRPWYELRAARLVDDRQLISSTWMMSLTQRRAGDFYAAMPSRVFASLRHGVNDRLEDFDIVVAVNPHHPDHILGWAAAETVMEREYPEGRWPESRDQTAYRVLHFVWVKCVPIDYRRRGLGTALVEAVLSRSPGEDCPYTFHTKVVGKAGLEEKWKLHYNPLLLKL
jgi:GNAT superfamily N-acetyltransferase